jgi:arylsulfatase A-like enzyme
MKIRYVPLIAVLTALVDIATAAPKKPNVIVLFTDDHGYSDLGCQGVMADVRTPNIDSLATNGVRMTAGYVTAPQCGPSRCGLISGQYQGKLGMDGNGSFGEVAGLKERVFSINNLPKRLKSVGYVTGMAGKSHLGSDDCDELGKLGFDKVLHKKSDGAGQWNMDLTGKDIAPEIQKGGQYHLELISSFACAFIERHKSEPFFFYAAYRGPHVPLDAPKKYTDRFPGKMPEERRKALGALSCIDDGVGRILETLRKNGLEENTLIFFISDNGAPLKKMPHEFDTNANSLKTVKADTPSGWDWDGSFNEPMNGEKGMLSEGGIRTPFLVQWKGTIPGGQVYQHPVISLDVAATANAISGQAPDPELDGVNLVPFLTGKEQGKPHDTLYWRWEGQYAIRKGDMKYFFSGKREYLYDLASDPGEKDNLLTKKPDLALNLRNDLEQWSKKLIPSGLGSEPISGAASAYFDYYLDGKKDLKPKDDSKAKGKGKQRKKDAGNEDAE